MEVKYNALHDAQIREKWIEDKKILAGPFIPSGATKSISVPTKQLLPDIIKELYEAISIDWEECDILIAPTEEGNIAVKFEVNSVPTEQGLTAYMNVFCNSHRIALKYALQKVVQDWNSKPGDKGIYFVFRPPWICNKKNESYLETKLDKES